MAVSNDRWLDPPLECDIVMKGGITSGVVYPGAVVKLASRYRFRSVGGTSAGALAAAAVAAAEFGRASGGFERLSVVPNDLSGVVDGDPFILTLFKPDAETRPLFDSLLAFQRFGKLRGVAATLRNFPRFPAIAAALAVIALVLGFTVSWVIAVAVLAIAPWVLVVGLASDIFHAVNAVAGNDFGLSRLGPQPGAAMLLTPWLHGVVQYVAGRSPSISEPQGTPLTFSELWGIRPLRGDESEAELVERRERIARLSWNTAERDLDLRMITTNLTKGRPMHLPFTRDRWRPAFEDGGLLFDPEEWSKFFPADIVSHLVQCGSAPEADEKTIIARDAPGRELLHFPGGADLPIVVAARLSLSFPVLISTVPMWQIQFREGGGHRLVRQVFSDGGISSNFPVHFFDAALPRRPTFALNLAGFERGEKPDLNDPRDCVRDPSRVTGRAWEAWKDPESMIDFAVAIKDALENWRDNAQARMPGFRERVIHIKLASGEGGLNLAMDDEKVKRLIERGEFAAQRLIELFSGPESDPPIRTEHWNDHRYARVRVLLSATERFLQGLERGYNATPDVTTDPYPARIAAGTRGHYPMTAGELETAIATLEALVALAQPQHTLDDDNAPRPRAVSRVTSPL